MTRALKAVYVGGIVLEMVIRLPYERQRRQIAMRDQRVSATERGVLGLLFVGTFVLPMVYCCSSWLDRANYRWSDPTKTRAGGTCMVLFGAALWLFWRAHVDLGHNWSRPSKSVSARPW